MMTVGVRGGLAALASVVIVALVLADQPCGWTPECQGAPPSPSPMAAPSSPDGFSDDFDDASDVTLEGGAVVEDGNLTVGLPLVFEDDFERSGLGAWRVVRGAASVSAGRLELDTSAGLATVGIGIDVRSMRLHLRFMATNLSWGGFAVRLVAGMYSSVLSYDGNCIELSPSGSGRASVDLDPGTWYDLELLRWDYYVRATVAGVNVRGSMPQQVTYSNLTGIELEYWSRGDFYLDDFSLEELAPAQGCATTGAIPLPAGNRWAGLAIWWEGPFDEVDRARDACAIDVLDGRTMEVVPGYGDLRNPPGHSQPHYAPEGLDLRGVDIFKHPSIVVRARLSTDLFCVPRISEWSIVWASPTDMWMDSFDDLSNVTSMRGAVHEDGSVRLDDVAWADAFDRTELAPWRAVTVAASGHLGVEGGAMVFSGGVAAGESTVVERDFLDQKDVQLELRFNASAMGREGLNVTLMTASGRAFCAGYEAATSRLFAKTWDGAEWAVSWQTVDPLPPGKWYPATIFARRDGRFTVSVGSRDWDNLLTGTLDRLGEAFGRVRLVWCNGTEGRADDVTLRRVYTEASFVSVEVSVPRGMSWRALRAPLPFCGLVDVLDGRTLEPVPGYANISAGTMDLTGVDPDRHPSLRLRGRMVRAFDYLIGEPSSLAWWQLNWTRDDREFLEPFDDGLGVEASGNLTVSDGQLTTRNVLLHDDFGRLDLAPWEVTRGAAELWEGALWMDSASAAHDLPPSLDIDLSLEFKAVRFGQYSPLCIQMSGPNTYSHTIMYIDYDDSRHELSVNYDDGTNSYQQPIWTCVTLETGTWYGLHMLLSHNQLTLSVGDKVLDGFVPMVYPEQIMLWTGDGSEVLWDGVHAYQTYLEGEALTRPVAVPPAGRLTAIGLSTSVSWGGSSLDVSMVDGATLEPIPGYGHLVGAEVDLSGVDPVAHPTVRLRFEMSGRLDARPCVDWCDLHWTHAPGEVVQVQGMDAIRMREDEPVADALDLRGLFAARGASRDDLAFSVENASDPARVLPYVRDGMLGIDLPTADWNGNATFRVACSYGASRAETADILVIVEPVDDPPVIADPGVLRVVEDTDAVIPLGPYITDVDTPVTDLVAHVSDPNCTVEGLDLHARYERGGLLACLLLEVSDGCSSAFRALLLDVEEANDAPRIGEVPPFHIVEDGPGLLDLGPYVSDEETGPEGLALSCGHAGVVRVTGLKLELLFETGGWRDLVVRISDGELCADALVRVVVEEVNDAPVILGLGTLVGPGTVNVPEGEEVTLQAFAVDEEDDALTYSVECEWDGVFMGPEGVVHVRTENGRLGEHDAVLVVTDSKGASSRLPFVVRVVLMNDPPDRPVIFLPANHSVWRVGDAITFRVGLFDRDLISGQVLTVTWASNMTGKLCETRVNGSTGFVWDRLPAGAHRITVTVDDGEFQRTAWVEVTVVEREGPPKDDGWGFHVAGGGILAVAGVLGLVAALAAVYMLRRRCARHG